MNEFRLPPPPSIPPDKTTPVPPGAPPRHKTKADPVPVNAVNEPSSRKLTDEEAEAQLQEMLDEEAPPIPQLPPQCDWHLSAFMAGAHPDPFSMPALHTAKQVIAHSMAALIDESVKAKKEKDSA